MTTLPTPEHLRSRAAAALASASLDASEASSDYAARESLRRSAAALAAYARELLTIAAQLDPAPPNTRVEHPRVGDVYRHTSAGDTWVVCAIDAVAIYLAGARPRLGIVKPLTMSRELFVAEMERAS